MTLERLALEAVALAGGPHPCETLGHKWVSIGGANCGCHEWATCSIPVHECEICGDCDYGDNAEAAEKKSRCRAKWEPELFLEAETE